MVSFASFLSILLAMTHTNSPPNIGVGAPKCFGAVSRGDVERIVSAWVFPLPVCGRLGHSGEKTCATGGRR